MTPIDIKAEVIKSGTSDLVRLQLERILQSESFRGSDSMRHMLAFLGEKLLLGDTDQLKEYSIGVDALGKPPSYDPRSDSAVRVQVGRLRQKLAEYYSTEGATDPLLMEIPKGQLRLGCRPMPLQPRSETADLPSAPSEAPPVPNWQRIATVLGVVAVTALILASALGFTLWQARQKNRAESLAPSEVEKLWAPFLASSRPLKIAVEAPMFIGFDSRRLYRDTSVNRWQDAVNSPEIGAVGKVLKTGEFQQRYHYAPFQEVNSAFLLGKVLSPHTQAYLVRSNQLSWEQMADTNWLLIGSPPFFGEVLAEVPVDRQFVVEETGVRNVHPKAGEPNIFLDSHTKGTYSPLGVSEDGVVYAVVTNAPGPAPNSAIRSFESNITSGRLGAVQWFTDEALASVMVKKLAGSSQALPQYYQVLLRVKYKDSVPVESSYVLHRELHSGPVNSKK